HLRRRHEDKLGLFLRKEIPHSRRIQQVHLRVRASDQVHKSLPFQLTPDRTADESAMARHIDANVLVQLHARAIWETNRKNPNANEHAFPAPSFMRSTARTSRQ